MSIPVLLAERDVLVCAGVAHVLATQPTLSLRQPPLRDQLGLEAALREETRAIALVADDLVSDLARLARLAAERESSLLLLTSRPTPFVFTELPAIRGTLRRGADARQLLASLQAVAAGEQWSGPSVEAARNTTGARVLAKLTPRQVRVMSGVARGAKNVEIARDLGTSEQVIKNMLGGIYDLAGVSDRLELALFVLHHPELAEAARAASSQDDSSPDTPRTE